MKRYTAKHGKLTLEVNIMNSKEVEPHVLERMERCSKELKERLENDITELFWKKRIEYAQQHKKPAMA